MVQTSDFQEIDAIRHFNRFYTKKIGLLNQGLANSKYSLTQARVLYELAQAIGHPPGDRPNGALISNDLIVELGIDPGYLSRVLNGFVKKGLLDKIPSEKDSRQRLLSLTAKGEQQFKDLEKKSRKEIETLLKNLSQEDQKKLLNAMETIETLLEEQTNNPTPYLLRTYQSGDLGWVVNRHGVLYSEEYGYDERFEAFAAEIVANFIKNKTEREQLWIAEREGEPIGSIMIVDAGEQVAQLRLFIVDPKARGLGVGNRLIEECIYFSKHKSYQKIKLWTHSQLVAARHLYKKAGFRLIQTEGRPEEPLSEFGHEVIAEIWELTL